MLAIYKKEIKSFYWSMVGYLYNAFFILVAGIFFTAFNLRGGIAEYGYVLGNTIVILLVIIPVLTMKSLGEEQRLKTDQLLFTAPIKLSHVVLGKFFAVFTIFATPLSILMLCPLVLTMYGDVLLAQSYSCFVAFLFMGAACISIGIFISSLTDNQIISAVATFIIMLLGYLNNGISGLIGNSSKNSMIGFGVIILIFGLLIYWFLKSKVLSIAVTILGECILYFVYFMRNDIFEGLFTEFLKAFSLFDRYYDFVNGVFDINHLVYYMGVTILFLFLSIQSLEKRRWS